VTLVFDGAPLATPGRDTVSWLDDPKLPHIGARDSDDGFSRSAGSILAVVIHTSKGETGPLRTTPSAPSTKAESLARYQGRSSRDVSWHFTIDVDGTVVQSADPDVWACWHAGQVNGRTVGIELVQLDDLALYPAQLAAAAWLVELLCARYAIPRTVPVGPGCEPWTRIIPELMRRPEGDSGASWRGVYGHRNCSRRRGAGDPGDHVVRALLATGFVGVAVDRRGVRTVGGPVCGAAPEVVRAPAAIAWPPVPSWIDEAREYTDTRDLATTPEAFVREALAMLSTLGVGSERALEVVAHCATESAWGRRAVAFNAGGVKLSRTDTEREERRSGDGLPWWRWRGHIESGDDPVAYYRAFESATAFWSFWLARYVPRSAELAERDRYIETGRRFWGTGDWFAAMLLAGYRGEVRKAQLEALVRAGHDLAGHPSIAEHRRIVERVRALKGAA
jgi:hypothetical protein